MVIKTDFPTSAFGGYKKDDVNEYIKSLAREYEDEIAGLNDDLEHTNAQLAEFKVIVEEQYAKIVDVTAQASSAEAAYTSFKVEADTANAMTEKYSDEIQNLSEQLAAVNAELKHTVAQKQQLLEDSSHLDENLRSIKSQIPRYLQEINDLKNRLSVFENAQSESDNIVISAKEQAQQILIEARAQIEETITLSEENQERARKLYDVAAQEADEIVRRAQQKANAEKGQYENCLKALERQKSKLLEALDCIKSEVSTIKIGGLEQQERLKSERPQPQSFREKYTGANRERFSGKTRY